MAIWWLTARWLTPKVRRNMGRPQALELAADFKGSRQVRGRWKSSGWAAGRDCGMELSTKFCIARVARTLNRVNRHRNKFDAVVVTEDTVPRVTKFRLTRDPCHAMDPDRRNRVHCSVINIPASFALIRQKTACEAGFKGPFMRDLLIGLAFVFMVVSPAIFASIQIKKPDDE